MNNSSLSDARPTLSKTAEYAIRAVLALASAAPNARTTADTIAKAIGAPRNYLSKTLYALTRAGIVRGIRGPTGGFELAIPSTTLTLAHIVDAIDEPTPDRRCLLGRGPCNPSAPCTAHARWSAIGVTCRRPLVTTTVAELLGSPRSTARTSGVSARSAGRRRTRHHSHFPGPIANATRSRRGVPFPSSFEDFQS